MEIDWVLRLSWFLLGASGGVVATTAMMWHRYSVAARVWKLKAQQAEAELSKLISEYGESHD